MDMNHAFLECNDVIAAFGPIAPSSGTVQRFSMKNFQRATVLIIQNKSAGNGSAIALKQAKEIDDNPVTEKVLSFTEAYRSLAVGTQAAPVNSWQKFTVSNDTFTTDATNSVRDIYAIDIKAEDLDVANDFDIVEVEVGNAASNVIAVVVLLHGARQGGFPVDSGIAD
jgi:predicted outer membrane repeat protein